MTPINRNFGGGEKSKPITPTMTWRELTKAGNIYERGNAQKYDTGDWRTIRPIWNEEKCIHCLFCWRYCPDASIIATEGKFNHFDYDHCKGCGICANVCPTHAIDMASEDKIDEEDQKDKKEADKDEN